MLTLSGDGLGDEGKVTARDVSVGKTTGSSAQPTNAGSAVVDKAIDMCRMSLALSLLDRFIVPSDELDLHLDWSAYKDAGMGDPYADIPKRGGDFAKAVAVCINARQCETRQPKRVMCPSYLVTGNPNLSTGGRIRLLKAALSRDENLWRDPVLREAMDTCVGCKGCKRECEANVDMALIKAEVASQRVARDGLSVRDRVFAAIPRWLRYAAPALRPLLQWRNRSTMAAQLGERWLGIAADSRLPEPASRVFVPFEVPNADVAVFVDTFTRFFAPEIADAAIDVLKAAGYRVTIVGAEHSRSLCCGRTWLAQGLVASARQELSRLVDALLPHANAGRPIVGLEPSCTLGLRDEAKAMGLGESVDTIADHVVLLEEFLSKEAMAKRLTLPLRAARGKIVVHGHCHQKATGAMKSMRRVLKLIPNHDIEWIDAGCCGMAGTFGLEVEHVDMAKAMAEDRLLPSLRQHSNARVVSNGFSCRQQIAAMERCKPLHLAEILRAHLDLP